MELSSIVHPVNRAPDTRPPFKRVEDFEQDLYNPDNADANVPIVREAILRTRKRLDFGEK